MRRDRDPRPPVEVIGAAGQDEQLQTVAVGGAGRPTRRGGAAVVLLALVVVGGLVLGSNGSDDADGDEAAADGSSREPGERDNSHKLPPEETTSTTRRARSTTTVTAAPAPAPLLEGSTASIVLIGRGPEELIALGSGIRHELTLDADVYGVVAADGGLVAVERGVARFLDVPGDDVVTLGSADYVIGTRGGRHVWLIQASGPYDGTAATLVDLGARVVAGPIQLSGWVIGAAGDGLLLQAGGRIFEVPVAGDVRPITSGEAVGVSDGRLFARTCDDDAVCGIEVWDQDLRSSHRVDAPEGVGSRFGATISVQPGGSLAALQLYTERGAEVAVVDLAGGPHRMVPDVSFVSAVAWLPGDEGLLLVRSSEVLRAYERGDELVVEELLDRGADQLVVIEG